MANAEQLQATLDQLHAQLEALGPDIDAGVRGRLKETVQELQAALGERETPSRPEGMALHGGLREAAIHFEQSHPTLAKTVERLIDVLAQMGI